jgi:asparagine synthetase B (glutamine-hydrolysing)
MLDGDFAFVIMDEKNDEIYAARDPGEIWVDEV